MNTGGKAARETCRSQRGAGWEEEGMNGMILGQGCGSKALFRRSRVWEGGEHCTGGS